MMKTLFKTVLNQELEAVRLATNLLENGQVIAVPTDTIYGLACDVQNTKGLNSLYRIKKRDLNKPIAICVDRVKDISLWGITDSIPYQLLDDLLPGPVTVVLNRTKYLNPALNQHTNKVGIRIPDCEFILSVINKLGRPLALTSANISNSSSCLSTEEFRPLWPQLAAVFDGGTLGNNLIERLGSTVVDLSVNGQFTIIRKGSALTETVDILLKYGLVMTV
ncbi:threonylcarbamoyl-AMP synthase-like [Lycorma delicatula]|uniref:threonylcarbamoyl-AMP synthase-like n=1 Tax=Lycorma delicatula TaxID=130591 RepID=UPI003F50FB5F